VARVPDAFSWGLSRDHNRRLGDRRFGYFAGYWIGNAVGTLKIGGDLVGGSAIQTGAIRYDVVKSLLIGGSLIGGSKIQSGLVSGDIGSVVIGHDIRGGDAAAADISETGVITAAKLGKVVVGGSILADTRREPASSPRAAPLPPVRISAASLIRGSIVGNSGWWRSSPHQPG
jgi:hypothetical protein